MLHEVAVTIIGVIAACCSTFGLFPQAIRVWRTKETSQLSLSAFLLMLTGATLWLCYGIFRYDAIIIAANLIALLFIGYILAVKISSYRKTAIEKYTSQKLH